MAKIVKQYITECEVCQKTKPSNQRPAGLLVPLPPPEKPWEAVSMDFITDLPPTADGHTAIFVVVDRFSKMAHFIPLKEDTSAKTVARKFFQEVVKHHGLP